MDLWLFFERKLFWIDELVPCIKRSFMNPVIKGVRSSFEYFSFHCAILEKHIPEDMNYCKNLSSVQKKLQHLKYIKKN